MTAVRHVLVTAGLAGALLLSAGTAWADPTPSADPSATASPVGSPVASPEPTATASPGSSPDATTPPTGTTDCGQIADGTGSPGLNPGVICQAGGINPGLAPSTQPRTTTDCGQINGGVASPLPPGTVCIAGGLNPGTTSGSGTPSTLPRTGPAPLVPTLALGSWLLLLGTAAAVIGRRRTARV